MEWNEDFAAKNLAGEGVCPWCGSDEIEGDDWELYDNNVVSQECRCYKCDGYWTEAYTKSNVIPL